MFDPIKDEKYPDPVRMQIAAGELSVISARAQRTLDYNWVAKRVPSFNAAYLGVITISMRDGGEAHIVDGQHRVELAKQVVGPGFLMDCEVFEGLTVKQEARLFLDRNDRRAVGPYDRFVASYTAEDPVAIGIVNILDAQGLVHFNQKRAGAVCAVATLQKVYQLPAQDGGVPGPIALARSLHVLYRAFGDASSSFEGHLIEGVGLFYARYGSKIETDRLVEKLSTISGGAPGLLGTARSMREYEKKSVARCVAAVVTNTYNKGRRSGSLGDWWAK